MSDIAPGTKIVGFVIPGQPKSQERPRMVSRGGKSWTYSPSSKDQEAIGLYALKAMREQKVSLFDGPVALKVKFYGLDPSQDVSNAIKLVEDGMNKVVYHDDKQIYQIHAYRIEDVDRPRTDVLVWEI